MHKCTEILSEQTEVVDHQNKLVLSFIFNKINIYRHKKQQKVEHYPLWYSKCDLVGNFVLVGSSPALGDQQQVVEKEQADGLVELSAPHGLGALWSTHELHFTLFEQPARV